jgi:hypothetical protein
MGSRQAAVLAWVLLLGCEMGSTKTPISERTPPGRTDDAADVEEQTGDSEMLSEFQREYDTSLTHPLPVFEKYLPSLGANTLLDFLERRYPGCHAQSHELGQAIFSTTRDVETALKRCDTRCTSGCMHGVVTAAFGDATFGAVLARMDEFCTRGEMTAIHKPGNCAHGLGHALMFVTHGDERRSMEGCLGFSREAMQYYCGTGVYMERFILDSASKRVSASVLAPCDKETLFPGACYRYKGAELWRALGSPDSVASRCARLDGLQRRGCYHGLGYAAIGSVLQDPQRMEQICATGTTEDRIVCVEGVIEKLADVNEGRARAACAFVEDALRSVCDEAVQRKMYGLAKTTFTLYYDQDAISRRRAAVRASVDQNVHAH